MLLPKNILTYFIGILSAPWRFNLTYLALITCVSHDRLTRALQTRYPWQQYLYQRAQKQPLADGYLIVDETEVDKSWSRKIPLLSWIKSHRGKPYVYGHHPVVIAWTNGVITYPLRWKVYQPNSGTTKIDLARELLSWAIDQQKIVPKAVLFDASYSQGEILKFLENRHVIFHTQLRKNRLMNFCQLRTWHQGRPYWTDTGVIKGKINVQITKKPQEVLCY